MNDPQKGVEPASSLLAGLTERGSAGLPQAGAVVNLSSLSAVQVNTEAASYNVCKAAQDHLTKTLARKYTKRGLRVNSVNPCYVRACAPVFPCDIRDGRLPLYGAAAYIAYLYEWTASWGPAEASHALSCCGVSDSFRHGPAG